MVLGKGGASAASAIFLLDKGLENLKANFDESDYFLSSKVTWGADLNPDGISDGTDPDRFYAGQDNKGYKQLWFNPLTHSSSPLEDNTVKFTIQPRFGLTFTPRTVSFQTTRYATDGGKLDIFWINPDGCQVLLAKDIVPCRDNSSPAILEWHADLDPAKLTAGEGACGLAISIHSLDPGKHIGISNVTFQGTITGEVKEMPELQSFVANGVGYNAQEIFEPIGKKYYTTIELFSGEKMISPSNPVHDIESCTGKIGQISYEGDDNACEVTIPLHLNDETIYYVTRFIRKPYLTLTYFNTDGSIMGTQKVEKDTPVGNFNVDYNNAITKPGYKVRGWFKSSSLSEKGRPTEIVTRNLNLYAVQTEEEIASLSRKYSFDLTSDIFYPEDHEAFILEEDDDGRAQDPTQGWTFKNGDKIQLLVGPKATIVLKSYHNGTLSAIDITDPTGNMKRESFDCRNDEEDTTISFDYEGEPGFITLTFNIPGDEFYLQKVSICNNTEPSFAHRGQWYFVKPGDVWSLFDALEAANEANSTPDTPRAYIFLPDGKYDMEEKVLTKITGYNISLIGQSMEGTIVVNAPDVRNESINTTATFLNESTGLYIQDMTIQNALEYYKAGSAGRAVVLQDKGTKTICKNVALLSHQDTYYSNNPEGLFYFDTSKVAGTVDFFCGGGTMFMENSIIQVEKRNLNGKGECTLTAPATPVGTRYGYIFSNCTIMNNAERYNLGRAWQGEPRCAFINTKVNDNKMNPNRWTPGGMSVVAKEFVEYNTTDLDGNVVSPSSKVIEFTKDTNKNKMETILTADQASEYVIGKVFPDWQPRELSLQVDPPHAVYENGTIKWSPVTNAVAYAIFCNGELFDITTDTSYMLSGPREIDQFTIRCANSMGGLGEEAGIKVFN